MRIIKKSTSTLIVYCAVFVTLVLWWGYFIQLGQSISFESILSFIGYVSLGTTILWQLWDRWLWKWPLLRKISGIPNLSGRWVGSYQRDGNDSDGRGHDYIIEIKQTFSSICCSTYQDNGTSSAAIIAEVCDFADRRVCVVFFWEGIPQPSETSPRLKQSQQQYCGLTKLTFSPPQKSSPGPHLDGDYFTNRKTHGSVHVKFESKKLLQRFC